ncbi:hypothetical protein Dsin_014321 [Dipteronia sinensis]|uniref:F-box domain-containing protein n=1 Tax=Dipteronia sinensis TaxID=43782 RepID=A0AAE0ALQ5_9ROSI|nr:hypothetical protein Dsin_014321 [Dipteronia sinensis]
MIGDSTDWNYEKAIDFLIKPAFAAEEVFNLVYQVCHPMVRNQLTMGKNIPGDTILHIAAVFAPSSAIPGAALQMQRELQWFKIKIIKTMNSSANYESAEEFCYYFYYSIRVQSFNLSRPRFRVSGITMSCLTKMFYQYILSCRFEELNIRKKVQIIDEMVVDRLSSLPERIIYHILSLMDTKILLAKRGAYVLEKKYGLHDQFSWSTTNVDFDHSLLLWHIATDLCYYSDLDDIHGGDFEKLVLKRRISKCLLDYSDLDVSFGFQSIYAT